MQIVLAILSVLALQSSTTADDRVANPRISDFVGTWGGADSIEIYYCDARKRDTLCGKIVSVRPNNSMIRYLPDETVVSDDRARRAALVGQVVVRDFRKRETSRGHYFAGDVFSTYFGKWESGELQIRRAGSKAVLEVRNCDWLSCVNTLYEDRR